MGSKLAGYGVKLAGYGYPHTIEAEFSQNM
jgi:hypothetical protein